MQDAIDTLVIYHKQAERIRGESGPGSVATESFQTAVDFALRLMSCWGVKIDQEAVAEVSDMLARELAPEKLSKLIESGILIPAQPEMPYANGAVNKDGTPKMKKAQPEKTSKKLLQERVERVCKEHGLPVKLTDKGGISTDGEVLETLRGYDEVIQEYHHRQTLQKLVTTYLPVLEDVDTIHPEFDVLKETGRTSSYAGKLYPSCNIQQVDPRVRHCYIARPGHVLCSVDYQAIELASLAQKCYSLFGYSVHRDLINEGVDLHAYLGAQLAHRFADRAIKGTSPRELYHSFVAMKGTDPDFYKHWRKFAKPVGLGYPGGMGAETFVTMARASYGIQVTVEQAQAMKEVWQATYPETVDYFRWVSQTLEDPANSTMEETRYAYVSPMGMYRAGATYCAAANGAALQTPTAEGAKSAVFELARACYDPSAHHILYGCRPVAFIHDELIVEIPEGDLMHDRAMAIAEVMVHSMARILPDVTVRAEPALMWRWDKRAEAVFGSDGRLQVWTPPETDQNGHQEEAAGNRAA
jgi:hypothetical protein